MAMPRRTKAKQSPRGGVEYRFKIDAYTPDTMPMVRLAEYMAQLSLLLGEPAAVHFRRLEPGSTVLVHKIDREAVPKVRARAADVRRGSGPQDAQRAYRTLNKFLREDNAVGALLDKRGKATATILRFPGRLDPVEKYAAIRQQGSIDGTINHIGGRGDVVHVHLESEDKQISTCKTTRAIAKELRHLLFEPVRLFGRGRWNRDEDGNWTLEEFKIENFEPLSGAPLSEALAELRELPTDWIEDAFGELKTIRHGPPRKKHGGH